MGKHANVQIWKKYEVKDSQLVRNFKVCPKCKKGILAQAPGRTFCGHCGYSEIIK